MCIYIHSVQLLSRVQLFVTPWIPACQASLSITNSRSSLRLISIESVMPSSHLILCHPLFLLPPIPPSITVFSNESTFRMRWPKYWSFSFSIIPSKEIPGLISFRIDWLDLLAVQGTLKSLLQHHISKASILWCSAFLTVQFSHPYMTTGKTIALTRWTFLGKVMSLLFNMLSRLVITFLPRSKRLLISCLYYNKNENKIKQKTQTNKNNTYPIWFSFEEEKSIYLERSTLNTVGHLKRCCVMWSVAQSYPILCSPKDCNQPGSSIHRLFQARILQQVANSYSRESYWFMMKPTSLCLCVGRWVLNN